MTKVAALQMASGPNINANLIETARLIGMAADGGAGLIVLPENFPFMGMKEEDKVAVREQAGKGHIQDFLAEQAVKHKIWLVGGTLPMAADDPNKVMTTCLLYNNHGEPVARYDKIHLFDVTLNEPGERYNESATTEAGSQVVVVDTPFGRLGLAICYDLRFPELFRQMVDQGAEIIAVPSAFTAITGAAHWEILLRARAVENLCYVIASAQGGYHVNGRETYGDSMIVNPWGIVLDRLPRGSGVVTGEVDLKYLRSLRQSFPVLTHRKL